MKGREYGENRNPGGFWKRPSSSFVRKSPRYQLRSEPLRISGRDAIDILKLKWVERDWGSVQLPLTYIENDYEAGTIQGDKVVFDYATGLLWQQAGTPEKMSYLEVEAYCQHLTFAGFSDWRLPTEEELLSLLEKQWSSSGLFINSMFDNTQYYCWSADRYSEDSMWGVSFGSGGAHWLSGTAYGRCVRSFLSDDFNT